jgi:hypothetical protein
MSQVIPNRQEIAPLLFDVATLPVVRALIHFEQLSASFVTSFRVKHQVLKFSIPVLGNEVIGFHGYGDLSQGLLSYDAV